MARANTFFWCEKVNFVFRRQHTSTYQRPHSPTTMREPDEGLSVIEVKTTSIGTGSWITMNMQQPLMISSDVDDDDGSNIDNYNDQPSTTTTSSPRSISSQEQTETSKGSKIRRSSSRTSAEYEEYTLPGEKHLLLQEEEEKEEEKDFEIHGSLRHEEQDDETNMSIEAVARTNDSNSGWYRLRAFEEDVSSYSNQDATSPITSTTRIRTEKEQLEKVVLQSLEPCQRSAIKYVKRVARELHHDVLPKLQKRIIELGYTVEDLNYCLNEYIRHEVPIVIHLTQHTLRKLTTDTHHRNLFETNTSGGCTDKPSRLLWEGIMFHGQYNINQDHRRNKKMDDFPYLDLHRHPRHYLYEVFTKYATSKPFNRPKYGCLNITGDVAGVKSAARSYGTCYLTLKQHVRYRSTFYHQDSGTIAATIPTSSKATTPTDVDNDEHINDRHALGTSEYYAHILYKYRDEELKAIMNIVAAASKNNDNDNNNSKSRSGSSNMKMFRGSPSICSKGGYKEVQIHGPICLETDIETLSLPGRYKHASATLKNQVMDFQNKTQCNILWQQDVIDMMDSENDDDITEKERKKQRRLTLKGLLLLKLLRRMIKKNKKKRRTRDSSSAQTPTTTTTITSTTKLKRKEKVSKRGTKK